MSIILLLHIIMLTFTFGHVELLTVDYHSIDTPIAELNNNTLREVFEGGNIWNDNLSVVRTSSYTKTIIGDEVTSTNTGTFDEYNYLRTPITTYASGNKYYYRSDVKINANGNTFTYLIGFSSSTDAIFINPTTSYTSYKGIITLSTNRAQYGHYMIITSGTNNNSV